MLWVLLHVMFCAHIIDDSAQCSSVHAGDNLYWILKFKSAFCNSTWSSYKECFWFFSQRWSRMKTYFVKEGWHPKWTFSKTQKYHCDLTNLPVKGRKLGNLLLADLLWHCFEVVQMNFLLKYPLGSSGCSVPLQAGLFLGEECHQWYQMCLLLLGSCELLFQHLQYFSVSQRHIYRKKAFEVDSFLLLAIKYVAFFCQPNVLEPVRYFIWHCQVSLSFIENPMNALHAHLCIQTQKLGMAFVKHTFSTHCSFQFLKD